MGRHRLAEMVAEEQGKRELPRFSRRAVVALTVALVFVALATAWALTSVGTGGSADRPDPGVAFLPSEPPAIADPETGVPTAEPSDGATSPAAGQPASVARFVADYDTTSRSARAFVGQVVVRNVGTAAGRWSVQILLPPAGSLMGVWNAGYEQFGRTIRFYAKGQLAPGDSVSFGFRVATRKPADGPDSCSISGRACT